MKSSAIDIRELLAAPRLSNVGFPSYRFTPGRDPHPVADPRGHSYQPPDIPHPQVRFVPSERWRDSLDYLYGCDLYNHGYWWEAHEAWEGLWKVVPRETTQRSFLQGVIQVSACHLKLFLGHMDGVARLRETSAAHLSTALGKSSDSSMMGIPLAEITGKFAEYFEECVGSDEQQAAHRPKQFPYILPE